MKLSEPQRKVLKNLGKGKPATYGLRGQSQFGGPTKVWASLLRRGLVSPDGKITHIGYALLKLK